jgi:hypothetical protein
MWLEAVRATNSRDRWRRLPALRQALAAPQRRLPNPRSNRPAVAGSAVPEPPFEAGHPTADRDDAPNPGANAAGSFGLTEEIRRASAPDPHLACGAEAVAGGPVLIGFGLFYGSQPQPHAWRNPQTRGLAHGELRSSRARTSFVERNSGPPASRLQNELAQISESATSSAEATWCQWGLRGPEDHGRPVSTVVLTSAYRGKQCQPSSRPPNV